MIGSLPTKKHIPLHRSKTVLRPSLIERLNEGLSENHKLSLISAPAGFGKTTLVSEWVSVCERPVAWLSLDEGNNNPTRFLTYLIAALQTIMEHLGADVLGFTYSVSHDLRTPLRTLDSFSELVLMEYSDKLDATGKNYLNRIRNASKIMDRLTGDLLKLSRITLADTHIEKVNLSEIAFSIADELRQAGPDRSVVFDITHHMTVYGDKALMSSKK